MVMVTVGTVLNCCGCRTTVRTTTQLQAAFSDRSVYTQCMCMFYIGCLYTAGKSAYVFYVASCLFISVLFMALLLIWWEWRAYCTKKNPLPHRHIWQLCRMSVARSTSGQWAYSQQYLFNAIPDTNHNAHPTNPNHNSKGISNLTNFHTYC